jgi:hypothetical protein
VQGNSPLRIPYRPLIPSQRRKRKDKGRSNVKAVTSVGHAALDSSGKHVPRASKASGADGAAQMLRAPRAPIARTPRRRLIGTRVPRRRGSVVEDGIAPLPIERYRRRRDGTLPRPARRAGSAGDGHRRAKAQAMAGAGECAQRRGRRLASRDVDSGAVHLGKQHLPGCIDELHLRDRHGDGDFRAMASRRGRQVRRSSSTQSPSSLPFSSSM